MAAIPPSLESSVIEQAGKGLTTRQIAAWLKEAHGVSTTYKSVARLLSRTRGERAEVAKVVLREKLGKSLTKDVDRLEKWAANIDELCVEAFEAIKGGKDFARMGKDGPIFVEGRETLAKLVEQLRKVTDTKLHFSGAEEDPDGGKQRGPVIFIPPESDD